MRRPVLVKLAPGLAQAFASRLRVMLALRSLILEFGLGPRSLHHDLPLYIAPFQANATPTPPILKMSRLSSLSASRALEYDNPSICKVSIFVL